MSDVLSDDPDERQKPVWEEGPDETDIDLKPRPRATGSDEALLKLLVNAQDALSRLDALAGAAPESIRRGLLARMALREAAGWLAFRHAWVHPLDLALRGAGVLGTFTNAQSGFAARAMPHTVGARAMEPWEDMDPFRGLEADKAALQAIDKAKALAERAGEGFPVGDGDETTSLLAARALDAVFRSLWSAYATLGDGADLDGRPKLRGDVARRVGAQDWRGTFLHLVAESALLGLRDLRAMLVLRERGAEVAARQDRRSRLPVALDRIMSRVLTRPKALAVELEVTHQAALAMLRALKTAGIVREATGRESFQAFTLKLPL